jgi:hypothetical protein
MQNIKTHIETEKRGIFKLSKTARDDFKRLYEKKEGVLLSDLQADLMAWRLLKSYHLATKK